MRDPDESRRFRSRPEARPDRCDPDQVGRTTQSPAYGAGISQAV